MTIASFVQKTNFRVQCIPCPDKDVSGAYIGDLLSWVMGKAKSGDTWITIMSNVNVIAVASLSDVACIILAEGVTLDDEVRALAEEKGVNVLLSDLPMYETALTVSKILL